MFHMPMSSPMMTRMFGFLPFFSSALATAAFTLGSAMASSWALFAPSEQQPSHSAVAAVAGLSLSAAWTDDAAPTQAKSRDGPVAAT